jgi:hypothetical protein
VAARIHSCPPIQSRVIVVSYLGRDTRQTFRASPLRWRSKSTRFLQFSLVANSGKPIGFGQGAEVQNLGLA